MSAGKGDKLRKGANLNAYWNNYDEIFRKKPVEQSTNTMHGEQHNETNKQQSAKESGQ